MSLIYAIIPARSGSKGVINKNIRKLDGKELIGYSIEFANKLNFDKVICSTDSREYAEIAKIFGAEVPFLRSSVASGDKSMEHDILRDMYDNFDRYKIPYPDIFVWLRPTFIFRRKHDVLKCIDLLTNNSKLTSARVVIESESRLYEEVEGILKPGFNDFGKSMVRRQDVKRMFRVFHTDVFRGNPRNDSEIFLGNNVGIVVAPKICGLDIDDETDFMIVESVVKQMKEKVHEYL